MNEEVNEFNLPQGWEQIDSSRKHTHPDDYFYIILARRTSDGEYVTWEYNKRSECYHGHYFGIDSDKAEADFEERIYP